MPCGDKTNRNHPTHKSRTRCKVYHLKILYAQKFILWMKCLSMKVKKMQNMKPMLSHHTLDNAWKQKARFYIKISTSGCVCQASERKGGTATSEAFSAATSVRSPRNYFFLLYKNVSIGSNYPQKAALASIYSVVWLPSKHKQHIMHFLCPDVLKCIWWSCKSTEVVVWYHYNVNIMRRWRTQCNRNTIYRQLPHLIQSLVKSITLLVYFQLV